MEVGEAPVVQMPTHWLRLALAFPTALVPVLLVQLQKVGADFAGGDSGMGGEGDAGTRGGVGSC